MDSAIRPSYNRPQDGVIARKKFRTFFPSQNTWEWHFWSSIYSVIRPSWGWSKLSILIKCGTTNRTNSHRHVALNAVSRLHRQLFCKTTPIFALYFKRVYYICWSSVYEFGSLTHVSAQFFLPKELPEEKAKMLLAWFYMNLSGWTVILKLWLSGFYKPFNMNWTFLTNFTIITKLWYTWLIIIIIIRLAPFPILGSGHYLWRWHRREMLVKIPGQKLYKRTLCSCHVLYHFCDTSFKTACTIFCTLKFHVVCTCTFFGDTICLLANRKMIKIVTLIDLHIVLTHAS